MTQVAIAAYFSSSVLYYVRPLPLGHLSNAAFLVAFVSMALTSRGGVIIARRDALFAFGVTLLACASLLAWMVRDDWDFGGLVRTATWLTPASLLVLLSCAGRSIDYRRIGILTGYVGLVINLAFTALFATFNRELGKFEVDLSWVDVSSNELSFHLVVFSSLFLVICMNGRDRASAFLSLMLSMMHLSKAHLGATVVASVVALCRRRVWLLAVSCGVVLIVVRWVVGNSIETDISFGQDFKRVLQPLVAIVVLVSGLIVSGDIGSAADLVTAVGFQRMEVYQDAGGLLAGAWVGHAPQAVESALAGFDPHSNVLYLALREGWVVVGLYLALSVAFLMRIDVGRPPGRIVLAICVYALIRSMFITFDPVKMICVFVFASYAVEASAMSAAFARRRVVSALPHSTA